MRPPPCSTGSRTGEIPTDEQWVECHLRHAELHISFLQLGPELQAQTGRESG
jgi:hypothetical protein